MLSGFIHGRTQCVVIENCFTLFAESGLEYTLSRMCSSSDFRSPLEDFSKPLTASVFWADQKRLYSSCSRSTQVPVFILYYEWLDCKVVFTYNNEQVNTADFIVRHQASYNKVALSMFPILEVIVNDCKQLFIVLSRSTCWPNNRIRGTTCRHRV